MSIANFTWEESSRRISFCHWIKLLMENKPMHPSLQ